MDELNPKGIYLFLRKQNWGLYRANQYKPRTGVWLLINLTSYHWRLRLRLKKLIKPPRCFPTALACEANRRGRIKTTGPGQQSPRTWWAWSAV